MPFNGSGTFQPLAAPTFPAVAGQTALAASFNAVITDIHTGLTSCLTRDGLGAMTADLPFGGFRGVGLADGEVDGDAVAYGQLIDCLNFLHSGTGAVEVIVSAKLEEIASLDDFDTDQEAIDACLSIYVPEGTRTTAGDGLQLRTNQHIYGGGKGSILQKSVDTNAYVLYASSKSGIIIENLAVDGARSTTADYTNSKFCIYLSSCTNCKVSNVWAYGALADNIVFEYGSGNTVVGCHSYNCNKDGIYASGSEDITITGNVCTGNGSNSTGGGIAISATWGATVTGNVCGGNIQFDILFSRGSRFATVTGNTLGSHLTGQSPLSIYVLGEQMGGTLHGVDYGDGTTYYSLSDSVFSANTCFAEVRLELLNDSLFSNNIIAKSADTALWLYGCTRVGAKNNKLSGWTNYGILISSSAKNGTTVTSECRVENNEVYKSGATAATALSKSGTNYYFGNTLNNEPLETGGSWTPAFSSDGTLPDVTYTDQQGSYAVVGDLVFYRGRLTVNAVTTAGNGNLLITGWPLQSLIKEQAFLTVGRIQNTQNALTLSALALGLNSSSALFYYTPTSTTSAAAIQAGDAIKTGFSVTFSGVCRIGAA